MYDVQLHYVIHLAKVDADLLGLFLDHNGLLLRLVLNLLHALIDGVHSR